MYVLYSGSRDHCTFIVHDPDGVGELEWATVGEDLATYITEEVYRSSCLFNICYKLHYCVCRLIVHQRLISSMGQERKGEESPKLVGSTYKRLYNYTTTVIR